MLDGPAAFVPVIEPEPPVGALPDPEAAEEARSFSFPRPVALLKTLTSGCTSLAAELEFAAVDTLELPATRLEEDDDDEVDDACA